MPASTEPQLVAGPIVRKVLLLRDGVEATDVPGGSPVETINQRIFADVYDVWPLRGEPTHYRIGNRRPIGWVEAADGPAVVDPAGRPVAGRCTVARRWAGRGTRGRRSRPDRSRCPVIGWTDEAVEVAVWSPDAPWERVERTGWLRLDAIPDEAWGVWLSRAELVGLLRRSIGGDAEAGSLRVEAVLGLVVGASRIGGADAAEAFRALPPVVSRVAPTGDEPASVRLGRLNDDWEADARWAGLEFRAIPLGSLPMPRLTDRDGVAPARGRAGADEDGSAFLARGGGFLDRLGRGGHPAGSASASVQAGRRARSRPRGLMPARTSASRPR